MQLIERHHGGLELLDTMNNRRLRPPRSSRNSASGGQARRRARADGRRRGQCARRPRHRPQDRLAVHPEHGDLEAVLAAADGIKKPKLRQSLIDHADNARLSRELVRLVCDRALPEPLDALKMNGIPPEPLREFLTEQGFRSLLTEGGRRPRYRGPAPAAAPTPPRSEPAVRPQGLRDGRRPRTALDRWIAEASRRGVVAVDTETDVLDCDARRARRHQPRHRAGQGLLHPARPQRRRICSTERARAACRAMWRWRSSSRCSSIPAC